MRLTHNVPVALCSLVLALGSAHAAPGDYTILNSLISPHPSPDGLAFDGQNLWVSDCQQMDVYLIDPADGHEVDVHMFDFMVDHLDYRGDHIWMSDHTNFYLANSSTLQVTKTVAGQWPNLMGVAEGTDGLWSTDPTNKRLHKVDTDGNILIDLPSPGPNPCGVGWDGRCVWVSDLTEQKYYQVDPADGSIELELNAPGGPERLPTGLAIVGGRFWVADEDPEDPRIYELDVEFPTTGPCALPTTNNTPDAGTGTPDSGTTPGGNGSSGGGSSASSDDGGASPVPGCSAAGPVPGALILLVAGLALRRGRRA